LTNAERREKTTFRLLLLLALSGIFQIYLMWKNHYQLKSVPGLVHLTLLLPIAITLTAALTAKIISGGFRKRTVFFKDPFVIERIEVSQGESSKIKSALDWLKAKRFRLTPINEKFWQIDKEKHKPVHSFLNHCFHGYLRIVEEEGREYLEIKLIQKEFILIETNENESLKKLADFLLGKENSYDLKSLPLTTVCGVTLLLTTHIFTYISILNPDVELPLVQGFWGAAGYSIWMVFATLKRRSELIGIRIGVLTFAIAFAAMSLTIFAP
jgi:hypothetical protein